jgi:hypothetical protein
MFGNGAAWAEYFGARHNGVFHVLRPDANTDKMSAQPAWQGCALQQPDYPREPAGAGAVETSAEPLSDLRLHSLRDLGRELTAALYFCEVARAEDATAQWRRQNISRRHGVLDGKIDPYTTNRRHGVGRVSDADQDIPTASAATITI